MRRLATALTALALSVALGAPALAGGWAVTTLDELPADIVAGDTYTIGYTIRQHGVTPIDVAKMGGTTEIQITSPDGAKTVSYRGVQNGPTGHYVAEVTFPYEGSWTWQVTQGPFRPQALAPVTVAPAAAAANAPAQAAPAPAAAPATTPQPAAPNPLLVTAVLLALAGAAILFGNRLAVFADRRAAA